MGLPSSGGSGPWRASGLLVTAGLGLAWLAGCGGDEPSPRPAADALAAGLAALDLGAVPLAGASPAAPAELDEVAGGMGGLRPEVRVQAVETADDDSSRATAVLSVTWDVDRGDQDWSYTARAPLVLDDEEQWRVEWSPTVLEPSLAPGERLQLRREAARRGEVLGARDAVLVTERPVRRAGIDKTRVPAEQAAASARALAELVDVDPAAFADRVTAAGPSAFVEALVLRDDAGTADVEAGVAAVPGAALLADELPLAPTREFARPVLGTVGEATAELVRESGGRLRAGDLAGLSGLQRSRDEQLSGQPGVTVRAVPRDGTQARELFSREPVPGQALRTTLDLGLQTAADQVLSDVGPPSALVAVQPSTGALRAVASGPGGQGYSTATLGRHAPGSTFKAVTSLGLLRAGLQADSALACTPTVTVDGRTFSNYGDYPASGLGTVPLRTVIAHSCNTALIAERDAVPQPALAEAGAALGLGLEVPLGVPAFAGSVPAEGTPTEHAASMIGQGRVEVSPLAMAVVAASIGQGTTVTPHLLPDEPPAPTRPPSPLRPDEADQLRALLRAVVTDGSARFLADVPGPPVLAKTGTAEYGTEQPPRTHAWMIGIQGDLAVAVFVEDGASGASTAGPLLEEFLRRAGTTRPDLSGGTASPPPRSPST